MPKPPPPAPWWDHAWPYRVQITCGAGQGDVAFATVTLAGHTTPDGRDLRLVDADGHPMAFEVVYHDPLGASLIFYRVAEMYPARLYLYYGNLAATVIDTHRGDPPPHPAVPRPAARRVAFGKAEAVIPPPVDTDVIRWMNAWHPQRGIVLRTYRKARPVHPETLDQLLGLLQESAIEGAGVRSAIADGANPFGPSQNYLSYYDGYLRIDQPGTYEFCTASADGSWAVIDGREVVSWPGPHTYANANYGQHHGAIDLRPGVVHVQYYQEAASGARMAYLGWKPPAAEHFIPIPLAQYANLRPGTASGHEGDQDHPLLAVPVAKFAASYWIRGFDQEQASIVEFHDEGGSSQGAIVKTSWDFGDSTHGEGRSVQHVYFRHGRPQVKLEVADAAGHRDTVVCAPSLYLVDVVVAAHRFATLAEVARLMGNDYDLEKLDRDDLTRYAALLMDKEDWPRHAQAVDVLLKRFPSSPEAAQLAETAAEACMHPDAYDPHTAAQLLELAIQGSTLDLRRQELQLRRAHLLAWDLADYAAAKAIYTALCTQLDPPRKGKIRRRPHEMLRRALLGLGDVALLSGDKAAAEQSYHEAEEARLIPIAPAERMSKLGSFPSRVEDYLGRDEYDTALATLDEWESDFPLQKLEGYTFLLRGKVYYVMHPGPQALHYLQLAGQVAPKSLHTPEAVWLEANCLQALKRNADARKLYERIGSEFGDSEYVKGAADRLKELEGK